ncbi:non-classical arabinogalactan protein 31-like [Solanum dulcamara]|uniref:non-classical arabinogalactan protein 31-like n=1 Tax=Solanum dulcamara TaxID=45834 RepID=UPI00248519D2|nr:non-classical arabinogalactan protein 31-like [Solanum dulcamara]
MAFVPTKSLGFILTLLLVTSFTVLGQNDAGIVTSELAPHSSVNSPPVEAPKPPKGGHHHHKHHSQPPASPPSHSSPPPAHSPSKPPTPPAHSPKKPPSPPVKPSTPPAHSPKKPPSPPVKPPTPPAHSPSKPPSPPVKPSPPPAHPPIKPPSPLPTRQFVGVRGVVYCKSCKYRGVETLLGASPIQGAVVKLACNNTKYHLTSLGTTDKNGYFFIQPKWLTTAGYHKCKVFLAKSPKAECSVPTNFHNGKSGAMLIPAPPSPMTSSKPAEPGVKLYNVGPFAFEPSKNLPCKTM